ncbi:hypothetical protein [Arthrobacter sp. 9E06]|nr:hypothetical protein [Arthrobacter sp. 9E06]
MDRVGKTSGEANFGYSGRGRTLMIPPSNLSDAQRLELAGPAPGEAKSGVSMEPESRLLGAENRLPVGLIRRVAVSLAAAAAAATALVLVRSDGSLVERSPDSVLGSAASHLAPAAEAWWMWLPVTASWLGYALYQWLPRQRENPRQERFGWLILASQIVAFAWLLAVSEVNAGLLLPVAAAQIAVGLVAVHSMNIHPPSSVVEGILADAPLRVSLAAGVLSLVAALAFTLTRAEADLAGWGATVWALVSLITVMVGITVICMTDRGHLSLALAIVWGLSCIAFERLTGSPDSMSIGVGAAVAAFLVLVSAGSRRHQVDHERRRSERQAEGRLHPEPLRPVIL